MKTKRIVAVIPIRKGSQRVLNKNLRNFADTNLLQIKIDVLKQVNLIDEIIVNTDSEEAIKIAEKNNISFHRREAYYASSKCSGSDFFEHLGKVTEADIFAYCPVTSPFISVETIKKCINEYKQKQVDAVATVSSIKEFLWLNNEPLNYQREKAPNSQDLPDIVALNFGFTITSRDSLIRNKNIIGEKNHFVITDDDIEAIDIDTPLDFSMAEYIYIKTILNKNALLE